MKLNTTIIAVFAASIGAASAATISVNFREDNANQLIASATSAGIAGADTNVTNWNDANVGAANNGNLASLTDNSGAATTALVTWTSSGTWGDGTANTDASAGVGNAQLMRGYVDDGAPGVDWTVTGIPFANYDVIVYYATDTPGGGYLPTTINGTDYQTTGTKNQYGTNPNWDDTNTVRATGLSGDLTVDNLGRAGAERASVAGFQIVEVVPEPSSAALLGLGGLALIFRRRK